MLPLKGSVFAVLLLIYEIKLLGHRLGLALVYLLAAVYLILAQGLFGESFVTLILGLPWTLALAAFEYFRAEGILLYILALGPIAANAVILSIYIGRFIDNRIAPRSYEDR